MKVGGLFPWNVTAICETYKISCLMGRHHVKGGSEYHLMASYSIWADGRSPYFCERPIETTSIWSSSLARKILRLCCARVADIEKLEEMDASELHATRLNAKEVLTPMKGEKTYSQSQMEQSKFLEEISV